MKFVKDALKRFAKKTSIRIMVRATAENMLADPRVDTTFDEHAEQLFAGDLVLSTGADIMGGSRSRTVMGTVCRLVVFPLPTPRVITHISSPALCRREQ